MWLIFAIKIRGIMSEEKIDFGGARGPQQDIIIKETQYKKIFMNFMDAMVDIRNHVKENQDAQIIVADNPSTLNIEFIDVIFNKHWYITIESIRNLDGSIRDLIANAFSTFSGRQEFIENLIKSFYMENNNEEDR